MIPRWKLGLTLILLLACGGGVRGAEEAAPIEVRTVLDRSEAMVGDRVLLTLEVIHPAQVKVATPQPILEGSRELTVEAPEIPGGPAPEPPDSRGRVITRFPFVIQAFETGEILLPAFRVEWSDAEGAMGGVTSESLPFQIVSVLAGPEEQLSDLKPPVTLPVPPFPWAWVAGLALLLAGAAILLAAWIRRRRARRSGTVAEEVPRLPPHEQAYQELEKLLASGLLQAGRLKLFHVELSEIVKRYLEGRFQIDTLERTTEEVLDDLKRVRLAVSSLGEARDFFSESDRVKFAKYRPSEVEVRGTVERAYRLVDMTKLVPPSPSAPLRGRPDLSPGQVL